MSPTPRLGAGLKEEPVHRSAGEASFVDVLRVAAMSLLPFHDWTVTRDVGARTWARYDGPQPASCGFAVCLGGSSENRWQLTYFPWSFLHGNTFVVYRLLEPDQPLFGRRSKTSAHLSERHRHSCAAIMAGQKLNCTLAVFRYLQIPGECSANAQSCV